MQAFDGHLVRFIKKPSVIGWLVFIILIFTAGLISYQRFLLFEADKTRELNNAALNARDKLKNALNQSFSATKTISFIITRYDGIKDFDSVAAKIMESHQHI